MERVKVKNASRIQKLVLKENVAWTPELMVRKLRG